MLASVVSVAMLCVHVCSTYGRVQVCTSVLALPWSTFLTHAYGSLRVNLLYYFTMTHIDFNPKVLWIETPSNPATKVTDIAAAAKLAHVRLHTFCTIASVCYM